MQRAVEFALGAGVQGEHLPPLFHERLFDRLFALVRRHGGTVAEKPIDCIRIKWPCIECMRM
ncbi:hypothetical protein GCM10010350_49920 [Streptomyces galilaeus]|nr:hypothetical protein GCM10010350_49920 [Streptomyces galilaeus]